MRVRELPPEKELLEHNPVEMFDTAQHISSRAFFRRQGNLARDANEGPRIAFLLEQCQLLPRAQKHDRTVALLSPVMMRMLPQVLTEEYSEHGVHVANVAIAGLIHSGPGTRALSIAQKRPEIVMDPMHIAQPPRSHWSLKLYALNRSSGLGG